MKKINMIFFLLLVVIAFGSVGTYGYFTWEESVKANSISVGKCLNDNIKIKVYASVGPLFDNILENPKFSERSINYDGWLRNAARYIINDLDGKDSTVIGTNIKKYENIECNNTQLVSPRSTIAANFFRCWMGEVTDGSTEYGTMIHPIVAIYNEANLIDNTKKINLTDIIISIRQWDIYSTGSEEFKLEIYEKNGDKNKYIKDFELLNNPPYCKYRLRTYNYEKTDSTNEFVFNSGNMNEDVDMIIFDIGSQINVSYEKYNNAKEGITSIYNKLRGKENHYKITGDNIITSNWDYRNHLYQYTSSMDKNGLVYGNGQNAILVAMETEIIVKYKGEIIKISEPYRINIGEENQ